MRSLHLALLLLCLPPLPAAPRAAIRHDEYRARRDALRKAMPDTVIVVSGATESERGDLRSGFFQESNFLYLTGWREPGAIAILSPSGDTLFLPEPSEIRERYTGRKAAPGDPDIQAQTGFDAVAGAATFTAALGQAAGKTSKVATLLKLPGASRVKDALPGREIADATIPVARLRMVKSRQELDLIQESIDATVEGHRAAWRRLSAGLFEYQIAATMMNVWFERGCERNAYPPIAGSGANAVILHYAANRRRMDAGELLLVDAGAECASYAADLTRTVPVSGRFTARQRELYDIVLGAQKAAIAAARPGMKLVGHGEGTLNQIALDYVNSHGKDTHGQPLGKYYLHQLGHHVGLDVHDPVDPEMTLAEGMVITIEPGIYIAEEKIGIRIEDMILITASGARLLSGSLPSDAKEIERALERRK